ncbi:hypothetical protein ACSBR2_009196 [Camellia fascicularis]
MKVLDRSTILKHKMVDQDYDGDGKLSFSEFSDLISAFGNQLATNKFLALLLELLFALGHCFLNVMGAFGYLDLDLTGTSFIRGDANISDILI